MLQDGKSFLHIAAWEGRRVIAHSVTLISGGCLLADATAYADFAGAMSAAGQDDCNVRAVTNATIIPTLLSYGSLPAPRPLLVLVTANVSLGFGLKAGSIPINRPVVLAGLYSVPTSIDMYMVVNQLNATGERQYGGSSGGITVYSAETQHVHANDEAVMLSGVRVLAVQHQPGCIATIVVGWQSAICICGMGMFLDSCEVSGVGCHGGTTISQSTWLLLFPYSCCLLPLLLLPVVCAGKYSKVYFLSLFIENTAPGDAISSLLSRPMSSAVSANVYAVCCDRWVAGRLGASCLGLLASRASCSACVGLCRASTFVVSMLVAAYPKVHRCCFALSCSRMENCLNLHNSTVVLASQQEMNYLNYM